VFSKKTDSFDIHGAHKREDVLKHLKENFGIDVLFIAGGLTSAARCSF
jgi:Icc-related predicted phosphoesterase